MKNKNFTNDEREKIIAAYCSGMSMSTLAVAFNCNNTTIYRIVNNYKLSGELKSQKKGGNNKEKFTQEMEIEIKEQIRNDCSITLKKLQDILYEKYGVLCGVSTIHRKIENFSYSYKRVKLITVARNSEQQIQKRFDDSMEWSNTVAPHDGNNLIFLDEVGFNVSMRCKYGRSKRGSSPLQHTQSIRSRNISVCCAMTKNEILIFKRQSCAFNTETFSSFINELIELLEQRDLKNMVFIMDNVAFHKSPICTELIISAGHDIKFLPPYSPFLNPIENLFSQVKQNVRSSRPNNEADLFSSIQRSFDAVLSDQCEAYYRHMLSFIPKCLQRETIEDEND